MKGRESEVVEKALKSEKMPRNIMVEGYLKCGAHSRDEFS